MVATGLWRKELGVRLRCDGGVGEMEVYEFCC